MDKYKSWIEDNIKGSVLGKCKEKCEQMLKSFPELKLIRGHYYCSLWGERSHWWLVDLSGEIIDPTSSQFPSKGKGPYVPLDEDAEEPIGRCINCGELCFESNGGDSSVCSYKCGIEMSNSLNDLL